MDIGYLKDQMELRTYTQKSCVSVYPPIPATLMPQFPGTEK